MSYRIGKYTYENKSVLKEFLSSVVQALARRDASRVIAKLKKDPEMKNLLKKADDHAKRVAKKIEKQRKTDKFLDDFLKSQGR